jgi:glycosyltransferase involved in cell wall biosynthesis
VLIYPSYRDAFSLTVLEALALGLGIVAYDVSLSFIIIANHAENPTLLKLALDSFKVKWLERKSLKH